MRIYKTNVDVDKFIALDSKEVCYILGFLWADGHLNKNNIRITLELVKEDIITIKPIFDLTGKWTYFERNRPNRRPQAGLLTATNPMYNFLSLYGFSQKSTLSPNLLINNIPIFLRKYWFRGFFDGDGCFYFRDKPNMLKQAHFAGSYNQDWTFIENLMLELNIRYRVVRRIQYRKDAKSTNSSILRFGGVDSITKFGNYIYEDYDGIGLKRKYDKFIKIMSS